MIEILYIIIQLFIFFFLFSLNYQVINKNFLVNSKFNYFESFSISIVLQLNIILFLLFLNINLEKIIRILLMINLIILILNVYYLKLIFFKEKFLDIRFVFLFLISLLIFFDISNELTLGWDAEKFWFLKALNLYHNNTIDSFVNFIELRSPFLGSLIWAFF